MMDTLKPWLTQEVKRRGWSFRELARQAGVSQALVSRTLSGDMPASAEFCIKVAQALKMSPEIVLRQAEILPPVSAGLDDPILQELLDLAQNLSQADKIELLNYARFRYQQRID